MGSWGSIGAAYFVGAIGRRRSAVGRGVGWVLLLALFVAWLTGLGLAVHHVEVREVVNPMWTAAGALLLAHSRLEGRALSLASVGFLVAIGAALVVTVGGLCEGMG